MSTLIDKIVEKSKENLKEASGITYVGNKAATLKAFGFEAEKVRQKISEKQEKQATNNKDSETPKTEKKAEIIDKFLKNAGQQLIDSLIALYRRVRISSLIPEDPNIRTKKPLAASFKVEEDKRLKAISPSFTVDTNLIVEADYLNTWQDKIDTLVKDMASELGKSITDLKVTWNDFAAATQFRKRCMTIWSEVGEKDFGIKGPHVKKIVLKPGLWAGISGDFALRKFQFYMASTTKALVLIKEGKLPGQVKWGYNTVITDTHLIATANYVPPIFLTYNSDYKLGKKEQTATYKELCDTIAVFTSWFMSANGQKLEPGHTIDSILTKLPECSKSFKAVISKNIPTSATKGSNAYKPNY